ncbi:MAG: hypothetical protein Q9159_003537 [Coniocarpon cinnabarinum]
MSTDNKSKRTPVYFLGIGGPNSIGKTDHPSYNRFVEVGREITTIVKPKALVVFSAHWQASADTLQINVADETEIIYDFYGFPPHYYEYKFPYIGSRQVAERVIGKLNEANIHVEKVERGLDHGVWAAFDPERNPLNVPIVQVSLYSREDPEKHYRIGQALESLRDDGILIMGTGMAVHNTADFQKTMGTGQTMPYASSFDAALKEAVTARPEQRQAQMTALLERSDARKAHPRLEHLLPIYVVAGAAGSDVAEALWSFPEGSLSWSQYRFGEINDAHQAGDKKQDT